MEHKNIFDEKAGQYDQWFIENDRLFRSELEAIRAVLPAEGQGIEIGVGTGLFAKELGIAVGLEPSAEMADIAKRRGIDIISAAAEKMPVESEIFDYALMVTVDSFLADVARAFHEVHRILKKGGVFVIAFIDRDTPLGEKYEAKKATSDYYRDAHFYTADEIEEFLRRTGFTVTMKRQTIFSFDNVFQEHKDGTGDGVFAVLRAEKGDIKTRLKMESITIY